MPGFCVQKAFQGASKNTLGEILSNRILQMSVNITAAQKCIQGILQSMLLALWNDCQLLILFRCGASCVTSCRIRKCEGMLRHRKSRNSSKVCRGIIKNIYILTLFWHLQCLKCMLDANWVVWDNCLLYDCFLKDMDREFRKWMRWFGKTHKPYKVSNSCCC